MIATRLLAVSCLGLLAACGQGQNDPGPGAVTMGEARALDDAAEMLEQRRLSPEDLRDVPAADSAPSQNEIAAGAQGNAGQ
ncbi:MAG: hypothetical protein KDE32_10375 [Novosphingobium sp.]|nr:hypothetical protein [Novosphingobium sp.]